MGIGNLNNNFGSLTAGKALNKTINTKNTAKSENIENANAQVKSNSLNSSTLNEQQGKIFDSNTFGQEASAKTASKGKGKGKGKKLSSWGDFMKDQWDKIGGAENYTGKDSEMFGAGVFIVGTARWIWNGITGGRMVSKEQHERSITQARGYTTNEFNNKKEHVDF